MSESHFGYKFNRTRLQYYRNKKPNHKETEDMQNHDFFRNLFFKTGSIDAYLLWKQTLQQQELSQEE